ncbi:MAG: fibronectin type III domain-containing protein, partial [Acidobacteriota bacterium]|nr:fibronectin type III domain-containing protein [Acidobacteriota bacterium]
VLDLHALAAEERASQRQPEEPDEDEPEEPLPGDEDAAGTPEPESPATEEPAATEEPVAPDPPALETEGTTPGEEPPPPDPGPPETLEPGTEDQPSEGAPPVATEEQAPAAGAPPEEAEPEPEQEAGTEPEQEAETEPEQEAQTEPEQEAETEPDEAQEEPDTGVPAGEETGDETPEQAPEPEGEPEPTGTLLDYEELEFEVLSEIESEVPGEERVLELPVEPDWIGRRLEITVRYEARGGASEESELQSLDVTGPLPGVEGVLVEVGPRELTIRWEDPRGALGETPLADPVFEVFRRRGEDSERLGRSFGPSQTDADVVWGEEVCYRARLVVAGGAEERVIPDPGPPPPPGPEGEASAGEPPVPDQDAGETPAPGETVEAAAVETVAAEPGDPEGEAAPASDEPEAGEAPWTPIPIRVPGTGTSALSVGPTSAEECVVPLDVFPPVPPSDLRLFWRSEQTELSWRDSASTDVAGYHVYRSGPDGAGFQRLTQTLVEQTSYTDAERDPRGAYRYAVTAVDGADPPNESLPSDPATANPR